MATDWEQLVNDIEEQEGTYYTRVDSDLELFRLTDKPLTYLDGPFKGKALPDTATRTSSIPQIFGVNVVSELLNAKVNIEIDSNDLNDKQKSDVVEWFKTYLEAIDEYLMMIDNDPLDAALSSQMAFQGRCTALVFPQLEDGLIVPHIVPWDSKLTRYQNKRGDKGACVYKMTRKKGSILAEYPGITIDQDEAEVWDCWDADVNDVLINKTKTSGVGGAHGLNFCPIVRETCHASPYSRDKDYKLYEAESIFAASRKAVLYYNEDKSIAATLARMTFQNGLQFHNEEGKRGSLGESPYGTRKVVSLGINEKLSPIPVEDLNLSFQLGMKSTESEIRMATLPLLELGQITGENTLPQITQANDVTMKLLNPRLKALARMKQRICRMIVTIVNMKGMGNVTGFIPGIEMELPKAKLDAKFSIRCVINPVSPLENIARIQMATLQKGKISDHSIRRDTLKVQDPDGEAIAINEELVEASLPKLALWKAAIRNLRSKDPDQQDEGALIALELGITPEQVLAGETPPPVQQASTSTVTPQGVEGGTSIASQQKAIATKQLKQGLGG